MSAAIAAAPVTTTTRLPAATTYAAPTYGGFGGFTGGLGTTGSFIAAPSVGTVGGSLSIPVGGTYPAIGATALPPVPVLGPTYQSPTYTAPGMPGIAAPLSPKSTYAAMTTPMSPTSTYSVPTTNMFAGYTTTPFMPSANYNLGTSTIGSSVIRSSYPTTYSAVAPAATYSTAAPATTYSTAAPATVVTGGSVRMA